MSSFRFIHTADIHLDSPLKGLNGQEGSTAERIRSATREAFDQLVTFAIEEKVDFIVIAGDLYDGDWRDYKTGLYFVSQMGRLNKAGIPVYLLHGNHDAESQITRRLELPENVKVFETKKPQSIKLDELEVVLHGQSYQKRDITDNLALKYPEPVTGVFNIGVLHTGLGGIGGHQNYAPCSLNDLINKGYDYWALGHVHQAEVLNEHPYIVFSGNLQGRHIRESGIKGAYLVRVDEGEVVDLSMIECDDVRWAVIPVELENCTTIGEVNDSIRDELSKAIANVANGRLLSCRIELQGSIEAHEQLLASEDKILAEARSIALGLGNEVAWIEKVKINTEPIIDSEMLDRREDAISELKQILTEAIKDSDLINQLEGDIGQIVNRLPHELRTDVDDRILKLALDGDNADLISAVTPYLIARLLKEEE